MLLFTERSRESCCYSQISRVQNRELHQMYQAFKSKVTKELESTGISIERQLWHGTDESSVQLICQNEFNRSFAGKNGRFYLKEII